MDFFRNSTSELTKIFSEHHVATMKDINLLAYVKEYCFIYEFILSTWLIQTWFIFSCLNVQPHTYSHAVVHLLVFRLKDLT